MLTNSEETFVANGLNILSPFYVKLLLKVTWMLTWRANDVDDYLFADVDDDVAN